MESRRNILQTSIQLGLLAFSTRVAIADGNDTMRNVNKNIGQKGKVDGAWLWELPDTPNGLIPSQCWHSVGSAPDGSIYIGGMDHLTNSALYSIKSKDDRLYYLGDAKSASQAAHNWKPLETAQKFHTRPLWHKGKIYVATLDVSSINDQYLYKRGFHWYAYDPSTQIFADLSAKEPGGTATEHGGLVTIVSDPDRNLIYGASIPTAEIYRYDVAAGRTTNIGRPHWWDKEYLYTNRIMWLDKLGRLYMSAGNPAYAAPNDPPNPSIYQHLYYYDPDAKQFFERQDWKLPGGRALEVGQCFPHLNVAFFSDDQGNIYKFTYDPLSWEYLGKAKLHPHDYTMWSLNVTNDGKVAYLITTDHNGGSLFEFNLTTSETKQICDIVDLGPEFRILATHTGSDAWDNLGRFYFSSFTTDLSKIQNVIITRIDPSRLKAALKK